MIKPFLKYFISACLILMVLPASTLAIPKFEIFPKGGVKLDEGEVRWGRILLHPGFAFQTTYNDNVFRGADKTFVDGSFETREEDVYFSNKPSLGIELQRGPGDVFGFYFDYKGEDQHFRKLGRLNGFNQDVSGGVNFGGPGGRFDITVGGRYSKFNNLRKSSLQGALVGGAGPGGGVVPVGSLGNSDLRSNLGTRIGNSSVEGYMDAIYSLSKNFKLKFNGDVRTRDLQGKSRRQNNSVYNVGSSFFWQATPIIAYGIKYNHRIRIYETLAPATNDNSDADQAYLAMKWKPSKLIYADLAVGINAKRFANSTGEDREDFLFQIYVDYLPVERTHITMRAYREVIDSSFQTIQSYVHTNAQVGLEQRLGKKFKAEFAGIFQVRDYKRSLLDVKGGGIIRTRVDKRVTGSVALIYQIQKWLEARAKYQYRQVFSSFDDKDYRANVGTFEIAAKY